MDWAHRIAQESYANRLKVGCVITKDRHVISEGYNGTPEGWSNVCEIDNVTVPELLHAEENAILKLAKSNGGGNGSTAFCTHSCCFNCARMLYGAGVIEFYYAQLYRDTKGLDFLKKAGVKVYQWEKENINEY